MCVATSFVYSIHQLIRSHSLQSLFLLNKGVHRSVQWGCRLFVVSIWLVPVFVLKELSAVLVNSCCVYFSTGYWKESDMSLRGYICALFHVFHQQLGQYGSHLFAYYLHWLKLFSLILLRSILCVLCMLCVYFDCVVYMYLHVTKVTQRPLQSLSSVHL